MDKEIWEMVMKLDSWDHIDVTYLDTINKPKTLYNVTITTKNAHMMVVSDNGTPFLIKYDHIIEIERR